MNKNRLEAFSDGVIAILITIMILGLKMPPGVMLSDLLPVLPQFLTYILSFIILGIYWNNHHHLLHVASRVNGKILWANLHLLFWLSLIPFTSGWLGENYQAPVPTAAYSLVFLLSAIAYYILQNLITLSEGEDSSVSRMFGKNEKGKISLLLYALAIPAAFAYVWISDIILIAVALMWLVPDKRIERFLGEKNR
jgi:uncharacterized membrane protein